MVERVPRLALTPVEAAACLGVSRDFFDQHILPELRIVRRGRRRLVPTRELDRWLDRTASLPLAHEHPNQSHKPAGWIPESELVLAGPTKRAGAAQTAPPTAPGDES